MIVEIEKPIIPHFIADWIELMYGKDFKCDDLLESLFTRNYDMGNLEIFKWFVSNKHDFVIAVMYGYELEKQPLYYAKIKGWEKAESNRYWKLFSGNLYPSGKIVDSYYENKMSIEEWNELGINNTNADFERVN